MDRRPFKPHSSTELKSTSPVRSFLRRPTRLNPDQILDILLDDATKQIPDSADTSIAQRFRARNNPNGHSDDYSAAKSSLCSSEPSSSIPSLTSSIPTLAESYSTIDKRHYRLPKVVRKKAVSDLRAASSPVAMSELNLVPLPDPNKPEAPTYREELERKAVDKFQCYQVKVFRQIDQSPDVPINHRVSDYRPGIASTKHEKNICRFIRWHFRFKKGFSCKLSRGRYKHEPTQRPAANTKLASRPRSTGYASSTISRNAHNRRDSHAMSHLARSTGFLSSPRLFNLKRNVVRNRNKLQKRPRIQSTSSAARTPGRFIGKTLLSEKSAKRHSNKDLQSAKAVEFFKPEKFSSIPIQPRSLDEQTVSAASSVRHLIIDSRMVTPPSLACHPRQVPPAALASLQSHSRQQWDDPAATQNYSLQSTAFERKSSESLSNGAGITGQDTILLPTVYTPPARQTQISPKSNRELASNACMSKSSMNSVATTSDKSRIAQPIPRTPPKSKTVQFDPNPTILSKDQDGWGEYQLSPAQPPAPPNTPLGDYPRRDYADVSGNAMVYATVGVDIEMWETAVTAALRHAGVDV